MVCVFWAVLGQLLSACAWSEFVVCVFWAVLGQLLSRPVVVRGFGFELSADGPLYCLRFSFAGYFRLVLASGPSVFLT